MIYTIEFPPANDNALHGMVVVGIEFWLNDCKDRDNTTKWYTECRTTLVPEGIVPLARLDNRVGELINDLDHLRNYRVWLNESGGTYNHILPMEEASKRMSEYHHPELKKRIKEFCNKYNLIYNVD